jgi:hypothetical protein
MKTLKLKDVIGTLKRVYPKIDPKTRFMYSGKLDRTAVSNAVAVYIIAWSDDGRATLHKTVFRKPGLTMRQWDAWLHAHAPRVINEQVRAYMNRTQGSRWHIEKVFGWHFDRS